MLRFFFKVLGFGRDVKSMSKGRYHKRLKNKAKAKFLRSTGFWKW